MCLLNSVKDNMSISVPFVSQWEQLLSTFMDRIEEQQCTSKEKLIVLWNQVLVSQGVPTTLVSKKDDTYKPSLSEAKSTTCPFIITRGEKMGEACGSGLKKGMNFCMKHTKDKPKEDEKAASPMLKPFDPTKEKRHAELNEVMTNSHRLEQELKKKDELKKAYSTDTIQGHTVVKGTHVIIQNKQIIGYWNGKEVCNETSIEVEKVSKEYGIAINRTQWKLQIDEISL